MKRIINSASTLSSMDQEQLEDYISDRLRVIADETRFARSFRFIGNNMYSIIEYVETIETNMNDLKDVISVWKNKGFPVD